MTPFRLKREFCDSISYLVFEGYRPWWTEDKLEATVFTEETPHEWQAGTEREELTEAEVLRRDGQLDLF